MRLRYLGVFLAACLLWPAGCSFDGTASGTISPNPSQDVRQADSGGLSDIIEDGAGGEDTRDEDGGGEDDAGSGEDASDGGDASDAVDAGDVCGDGVVSGNEACDDGNTDSGDGCDSSCQIETGWACPDAGEACEAASCGDAIIAGDEQCDDGNRRNGDGCDFACQVETGYQCLVPGEPCVPAGCGDGIQVRGEECDDGNNISGDGCSATCRAETGFECPFGGGACTSNVVCGDGQIGGAELCDDGNLIAGDGCDSNCQPEPGWRCQIPGQPCEAARCGDGVVAGNEECDDGNNTAGDGCDALCKIEPGFTCQAGGTSCVATVCGDGIRQGSEACDDGNNDLGDGCTPFCTLEPTCPDGGGACSSSCGDGIRLAGSSKECEDGNTTPGDGCSPTCTVEPGFVCNDVTQEVDELTLPLVLRDFSIDHPDFEHFSGSGATTGMVKDLLDADGKPEFLAARGMLTSAATFYQWYRDVPGVNQTFVQSMTLSEISPGTFQYSNTEFFPLDGLGYGFEPGFGANHNYAFTSEVRYWFVYRPGQVLTFSGDDDLWVFINKQLALDLGGLHARVDGTVDLDAQKAALGLQDDALYEVAVFQAERHSTGSNYTLTLGNFVNVTTECESICGDGIQTRDEACDDGVNDGSYGGCNADCSRGPYCGDGDLDPEMEQCDNGVNQDLYGENGCAPDCRRPAYCGDGAVDSLFGEECDDGTNDGSYGTCTPDCKLAARCGDGIVQDNEACDDGNAISGDGCSSTCQVEG